MTKEDIFKAIQDIDQNEVVKADKRLTKKKTPILPFIGTVAACFTIAVLIITGLPKGKKVTDNAPNLDNVSEKTITASFVADIFNDLSDTWSDGTTKYTTDFHTDSYLAALTVPDADYLPIYKANGKESLEQQGVFSATHLPSVLELLGFEDDSDIEPYNHDLTWFESVNHDYHISLYDYDDGSGSVSLNVYASHYTHKKTLVNDVNNNIEFFRNMPIFDSNEFDEQHIKDSLKETVKSINKAFDTDFEISGIDCYFSQSDEIGNLIINLGNSPKSLYFKTDEVDTDPDDITITFKNIHAGGNTEGNPSEGQLRFTGLYIWEGSKYEITGKARLLSVQEAEQMLEKGYVFSSGCWCTQEQDPIDFSEYDYIGLEYKSSRDMLEEGAEYIPFYAFYKHIGDGEYAKTYVCAVEVEGIEDYFEKKYAHHNIS